MGPDENVKQQTRREMDDCAAALHDVQAKLSKVAIGMPHGALRMNTRFLAAQARAVHQQVIAMLEYMEANGNAE